MAYLLLLHQKMSLKRKVNKLTLAQTTIGTRKDRITKRIETVQKSFARKQSKLEAQAKRMTSMTNSIMNNYSMAAAQQCQMMPIEYFMQNSHSEVYKQYQDYQKQFSEMSKKENYAESPEYKALQEEYNKFIQSEEYKNAYNQAQNAQMQANQAMAMQKQMIQQYTSTMTTNFNDQVSIWLEAQTQALEDEEEMALAPLNEEDTLIDIEQASNEAQLSYAQSRLESIESALSNQTQEAPKFGA